MAVTPHRWFASGLRNGDDGLEQHKGPVGWTRPGPFDSADRSSAWKVWTERCQPPPHQVAGLRVQAGPSRWLNQACQERSQSSRGHGGSGFQLQRCPFDRGQRMPPGTAWRCHRSTPPARGRPMASARWSCTTGCQGHDARSLPQPARGQCDSSFRTGSSSASRAAAAAAFFAASLLTEEPSFLPRALAAARPARCAGSGGLSRRPLPTGWPASRPADSTINSPRGFH